MPGDGGNRHPDNHIPGLRGLIIVCSLTAAVLGTPILFGFIGPYLRDVTYAAYGNDLIAELMYWVSYALSGAGIYFASQITFWTAVTFAGGFAAVRSGMIPAMAF